ncbi:DUF2127 domain-containing protein [Hydrogenophaga sp.]|uniref:DUF2127 domain-containing protein n=1 Tax=Hydrogenophaga sp. TaxID=1904254 RepID=UPI002718B49E|nr:DUF2127 domain-containing protein [Hydrogenophaga sp.]MDO9438860.1 DUF2127 domain-containing protein [Hydrogenophaga sp.]
MRLIAAFEGFKGVLALAASLGFLSLLHKDLHAIAAALIGHIGLDPGDHYPALVLDSIDRLRDANIRWVLLAAAAYVLVRFCEAFALWNERPWGEKLGALSGTLYVPFELRHFAHNPTAVTALVVVANVVVIGFLVWRLRQRGRSRHLGAVATPRSQR